MQYVRHPKVPASDVDDGQPQPTRSNRLDLRVSDEQTLTQDQVMLARGYVAKPGGGWELQIRA